MDGFFSPSEVSTGRTTLSLVPKCGACGLYKKCQSPKMPVSGKGRYDAMIVGEAPGQTEDEKGRPFVGKAGQLLRSELARVGMSFDKDFWTTNALICFTGDTVVESPSRIFKVYRRLYTGELLRIKTSSGRVFTGTPNHPVLTPNGWISLGLIKEGDDLIHCTGTKGPQFRGSDIDDPPTTFEEIFDTFANLNNVHRMIGRSMDFHGDGENGYVDVVGTDGLLWDGLQAEVRKHRGQLPFKSSDKGFPNLFGAGGFFGSSENFGSRFLPTSDSFMGRGGDGRTPFLSHTTEPLLHAFAPASDGNTCAPKQEPNFIPAHAKSGADALRTLPGLVTTEHVVKIERKFCDQTFDGDDTPNGPCHVYNLETEEGYYIVAGGIVMSNCRPPGNLIADGKMIEYCRPNLMNAIKERKPKHILLFGRRAVASLIGHLWDSDVGPMTRWTRWKIPCQELNAWIYPNYHPSYVLRQERDQMLAREFRNIIESSVEHLMHNQRPWKEVPNYESKVSVILDHELAAKRIAAITVTSKAVAFDFETNMLKPDSDRAKIVCCSMSNGQETIAYPWHGKAIAATKQFLLSPVKKIGYNLKFEERWCLAKLGIAVRNWIHDGMITAHALDYRKEITGLKFQAFVLLGQKRYDAHIEPYLKAPKGPDRGHNTENQIDRIAIKDLLLYCGMDSLLEYEVAKLQRKIVHGHVR